MSEHSFEFFCQPLIFNYEKFLTLFKSIGATGSIDFKGDIEHNEFISENESLKGHGIIHRYNGEKNISALAKWFADFENNGSYSFGIESTNEYFYFYLGINFMDLNVSACSIYIGISPWYFNETYTTIEKKRIFDTFYKLLKDLSKVLNPFYGFDYLETYSKEIIWEYIIPGKARYPKTLTFWGRDYPSKPNVNEQEKLIVAGFLLENTEQGLWIYYPPDKWFENEFFQAMKIADNILQFETNEVIYR